MTGIGMADLIRSKPDKDDMKATPISEFVDIVDMLSRKLGEIYGTKNKIKAIELAIPIQLQEGEYVRELDEISTAFSLIKIRTDEQKIKEDKKLIVENKRLKDKLDIITEKVENLEVENGRLCVALDKKPKEKEIIKKVIKERGQDRINNSDKIKKMVKTMQKLNNNSLGWDRRIFVDKLNKIINQLLAIIK